MLINKRSFLVASLIVCISSIAGAQTDPNAMHASPSPTPSRQTPSPSPRRPTPDEPTKRVLTTDEQRALWTIENILTAAKSFDDQQTAIRIQAQAAAYLWSYDEARARREFEQAFRRIAELKVAELKASEKQTGAATSASPSSGATARGAALKAMMLSALRAEVAGLIAQRDAMFARRLIDSIVESAPPADAKTDQFMEFFGKQSERAALYMQTALRLAPSDPRRAAELVRTSLAQDGDINLLLPGVLLALRRQDAATADDLFRASLQIARRDPSRFSLYAGTLASYAFPNEPAAAIYNLAEAEASGEISATRTPPPVALINEFLAYVYEGIMRSVSPDQSAAASSQASGSGASPEAFINYAVAQQMLPMFERYAPDKAVQIRAYLETLARRLPNDNARHLMDGLMQSGTAQDLIARAEQSTNGFERAALYQRAATQLAREGEMERALAVAAKIESAPMREAIAAGLRAQAAEQALNRNDVDAALRFARPIVALLPRTFAFNLIARRLAEQKDTGRAAEVANEAAAFLKQADESGEKARALLMLTATVARFDALRGFELLSSAVDAINKTDDRAAPQNRTATFPTTPRRAEDAATSNADAIAASVNNLRATNYNFTDSLQPLARADFGRTLESVQAIKHKETSALAQLAACREVLADSPSPRATQK